MKARGLSALAGSLAVAALLWPSVGLADHVSVEGSVAARVERFGLDSWLMKIEFSATCRGVGAAGASYQGNLYVIDLDTGESTYLGGVFGASGEVAQLFHSTDRWRRLAPLLKVSCFDNGDLHGSDTLQVAGGSVLIPPRLAGGAGSGGGGGGDSGGGGGSAGPTEPLQSSGCLELIVGTGEPDTLAGNSGGDVVFGLGKGDRIRGADGHDCLIGGPGADVLRGGEGSDRLTGGGGPDRLLGGPGRNAYDAGPGRDFVDAANGTHERLRCGPGRDRVRADAGDLLTGCEVVLGRG